MSELIAERDVTILFDVSRIPVEGGIDEYLLRVLDRCVGWFSASGISVFIRQRQSDIFLLAAKLGADNRVPDGATLKSGEGIAGACIEAGTPMIVLDPSDNPLLHGKVRARDDIGSAMIVPLATAESGCIGVLNVSRRIGEPAFSGDDLQQASQLARHIALAVGNARLFSEMNAAVAATRTANEKLDAIISCLGVGLIVFDAEGALEQWNPEAERIFSDGLARGRFLLTSISSAPAELVAAVGAALRGSRAGKRHEERAHSVEVDRAWSVVSSPLPGGGGTVAIQDVTLHDRALRELGRVRRLAEIGQMTAAIAHEIRNPLTGIVSAAQMVAETPGEVAEFGRIIEDEALKLNELCDEFLDFARPLNLHIEPIDCENLVRRVCAEYATVTTRKRVVLSLKKQSKNPKIKGDAFRTEQVCRNLILNAIQAAPEGGTVVVGISKYKLFVEDDGPGLEPESLQKLFTPFYTTKANGTGLGLSNVRKIVDAHGWKIGVDSRPGGGTRFEISFLERRAA